MKLYCIQSKDLTRFEAQNILAGDKEAQIKTVIGQDTYAHALTRSHIHSYIHTSLWIYIYLVLLH